MTLDLDQVPWDQIGSHSLIVTRLSEDRLDAFVYALRDHVGDSPKVAPMTLDAEVFVIDEATMNQMGWVRR